MLALRNGFANRLSNLWDDVAPNFYDFVTYPAKTFDIDAHFADNVYVVRAEVPGVDIKDIDISTAGDEIEIAVTKEKKYENCSIQEISYGKQSRKLKVSKSLDTEKASAELKNGVLTLTIPLRDEFRKEPKKIEIKT